MFFGVDYYPEHWVWPYAGSPESPEGRWKRDVELMVEAGVNVVRMGEFAWGLYEPEQGRYDFEWMRRAMDLCHGAGIKVVLGTPTAAPPLWLARKHPEILPIDEHGQVKHEGTRRAYCMNSDVFWDFTKRIVTGLAKALGAHPALIAWQVDNGLGGHFTEASFNEETRRDWTEWLRAKYETVEKLNDLMGLRFWTQTVTRFEDVPMPMAAPTVHNPALLMDWMRFSSDTIVAYARMQADLLRELAPGIPVTQNLRALTRKFDHFDMAEVLDFVSVDSNATIKTKSAELACEIDMMRSLKKTGIRTPDGESGFWVIEQKANNVDWQEVNSLVRPGVVRMFTHQLVSRGATGVLYFLWRQPRIGSEKFYGGVLTHDGRAKNRMFEEIKQIGRELKHLAPLLKDTSVTAEACILISHDNDWNLSSVKQPNKYFNQREHVQLFYNAFHDRNIPVDFARPTEDLSRYKIVIAPSLQLLAGGEADLLKLYVQNGGTLVGTFNTGLVDEHHIAPDNGVPHNLTDLFGLEVLEFDPLPPGEENHITLKGQFSATHLHPARFWCDIIETRGCQVLGTYAKDFYSGRPVVTLNTFGSGRAVYIGTMSHQFFYNDLVVWMRQLCGINPLLKVPDQVEVSLRQKEGTKVFFLINHQNSPVRISFLKPMYDAMLDKAISGNHDLPPHGVLVLSETASG
ncbi:MAG: beta-galactosidase [Verrucomicrobiota bacterium]|jgi:beta-galactosidase